MKGFLFAIEDLNFGGALVILVIGMLIILAVLSILVGLLYVIRYVVAAIEKEKAPKTTAITETAHAELQEDEEIVAAITAAITCVLQEELNNEGNDKVVAPFIIKKIKHIR